MIRYCDDFIVGCESKYDAERFLTALEERFKKFNLEISPEKTKLLPFGRNAWLKAQRNGGKVATFNFLGFTHYCGKTRNGKFVVWHKTTKQNISRKLKDIARWLANNRHLKTFFEIIKLLRAKMLGHYNYFGINGNIRSIQSFYKGAKRLVFKWMNRRSQRKSMNWKEFERYLDRDPLPPPKIYQRILF